MSNDYTPQAGDTVRPTRWASASEPCAICGMPIFREGDGWTHNYAMPRSDGHKAEPRGPVDDEPPVGSIVAKPGASTGSACHLRSGVWLWAGSVHPIDGGWPYLRDNGYVVIRHGWGDEPDRDCLCPPNNDDCQHPTCPRVAAEHPAPPFPVGSTVWHVDGRGPWTVVGTHPLGGVDLVVSAGGLTTLPADDLTATPAAPEPGSLVEWDGDRWVMALDGLLYWIDGTIPRIERRWVDMPGARILPLDGGES